MGQRMLQPISVITPCIRDVAASRAFKSDFGWKPVLENEGAVVHQTNGLMLGTWLQAKVEEDTRQARLARPGVFALVRDVGSEKEVDALIDALAKAGGKSLHKADAPPHGDHRDYVADPDDHAWEMTFSLAWKIDARDHLTFDL
jgi:uncharacterized protein